MAERGRYKEGENDFEKWKERQRGSVFDMHFFFFKSLDLKMGGNREKPDPLKKKGKERPMSSIFFLSN